MKYFYIQLVLKHPKLNIKVASSTAISVSAIIIEGFASAISKEVTDSIADMVAACNVTLVPSADLLFLSIS